MGAESTRSLTCGALSQLLVDESLLFLVSQRRSQTLSPKLRNDEDGDPYPPRKPAKKKTASYMASRSLRAVAEAVAFS